MGRFSKILNSDTPKYVKEQATLELEASSSGPEELIKQVIPDPKPARQERRKPDQPLSEGKKAKALATQIRLHGRLLDEIDLSTLEGLDESDMRRHVSVAD